MSTVAQKQDLSDPDVIAAFAQRVGNERNLMAMYLLTVADIRGTSPKVWNAWKGKLLEDLYKLTVRTLGGRAPDPGAVIESRKRQALIQLALATGGELLHAPRRRRNRLAHAPAGTPCGAPHRYKNRSCWRRRGKRWDRKNL